ncbi:MAG: PAS domain S-box protein [Pyrinomonadaceae bacterium]
MNIGDFRDAILSFRATPWWKSIGMFEGAARRITSAGRLGRKRAEEALRESEERYRDLVENSNDLICTHDLDGLLLSANRSAMDLMGYSSGSYSGGTNFREILAPEVRDQFDEYLERIRANRVASGLMLVQTKTGEKRIWEYHNTLRTQGVSAPIVRGMARDITEQKRAEKRLRQSERQLAEAQRTAHLGSWSWDLKGEAQIWSDELYRIYGLQPGKVAATSEAFLDLLHPEDRLLLGESVERASRTEKPFDFYLRIIRPDGEERVIHSRGRILYDDQGTAIRRSGTAQDVTEYRRAEEAVRAAEQKYRDIFENAVEGIFQTTADGRFVSANPALVKMLGFSSLEELIRERADVSNQHYVDPKCHEELKRRLDEQGVVKGFEYQGYRKDGSTIWLSENVRTVRDEGGEVLYYEGTTQDITEGRRANHRLRLFRTLIDRSSDAIEVIDPNTLRFLDCNESAYHDLGYSREEFLSLSVCDIDPLLDERKAARLIEEMDASGFVIFESIHRRKDGSTFPVEINLKIVRLERDYRLAVVRDTTERKLGEEALRQAEQKYRSIFENASEGIFQSTPDGRYIAANPALARMLGFASPEDLIHTRQDISRQTYLDPTRREKFKRELGEQGALRGFEHQVFRKDGSRIWISVNARAVRDEGGEIQYYEGTAQDITDRKRAEEALRESEERYRELFENAKDAIFVQDLGGVYISVNRAAETLSGYDRKEIIGKHFDQFVAPEYLPLACANLAKKLPNEEQTAYEIEVIARNGRRVPVELSSGVIFKQGVPVGIQGIARDITKRKRAEDDLRQQKEILQKIFDHIPVMIRLTGPDGDVQLVNREYERTTGWSLEEIQKEPLKIFAELYPDKHERQLILDRIARATGEWGDFRTRGRDGRVIDTSWANIRLSAGMSLGIGQDISVRKRAEETLRSYSRQLIEAQEAERQHIARELHDQVGQVLTAVRINLQTIWNLCETAESRSLVDQGVAAIDTALEQVRNLSFELRPSLLDDLGLVSALRWYSDQYTQRTGIRTRSVTNLPEGQTRLRRELETACLRIVQEALTNVVRHAKAKNVFIDLSKLDHKIVLSIKDDGIGFDESSNGGASAIHLGLRGMKERALAVGGTLDIESGSNRGTEVRAHFPTAGKED